MGASASGPGAIAFGDGAQEVSAHSGDAPSRSSVKASIPPALKEAIGNIVSMCADARDTFPDSESALGFVTDTINELYGCIEDGVFGVLTASKVESYREALWQIADLWTLPGLPTPDNRKWHCQYEEWLEAARQVARQALRDSDRSGDTTAQPPQISSTIPHREPDTETAEQDHA